MVDYKFYIVVLLAALIGMLLAPYGVPVALRILIGFAMGFLAALPEGRKR